MNRSAYRQVPLRRAARPFAWALAAGLLLIAAARPVGAAGEAPAKSPSGCVACHTDLAKLQEEAKGIPVPAGSALQAGKG